MALASCRRPWRSRNRRSPTSGRWARRLDGDGVLQLGGCDARRARRASSARPPTSSPRTTCARAPARSSAAFAAPRRRLRGPLRLQGVPLHRGPARSSPRRAWPATSPPAASWRWRCAPASTRARSTCTATPRPSAELREALDAGRRRHRRRQPRRARRARARSLEPGARQRVLLRIAPGVSPDTHPTISTGGPNTKFGFNPQDARRRHRAACAPTTASTSTACTSTSARRSSTSQPFRAALRGARRARRLPHLQPRRRPRRRLHVDDQRAPSIEDYVAGEGRARATSSSAPASAIADEPGRALVANSMRDALHACSRSSTTSRPGSPSTAA